MSSRMRHSARARRRPLRPAARVGTKPLDGLEQLRDALPARRRGLDIGGRHSPGRTPAARAAPQSRRRCRSAPSRSALLTTKMSAISMMPAFSAWTSSPAPGHNRHDRHVGRAHDVDFVLADADGLDQHDVLAGGVEHQRCVARGAGETAEMPARRHAADEHAGVARVRLHPHPIAQHGAAGERAGGIDRDDADGAGPSAAARRQAIDERALPGAWRSGDADEIGPAGVGEELPDQRRARPAPSSSTSEIARATRARRRASTRRRVASRDPSLGEQLPRNDEPLDFARPFADGQELDVAKELLGRIVLHEAVATVNLDAVVGGLAPRSRSRRVWPWTIRASSGRRGPSGTPPDRSAAGPPRSAWRCPRASTESPGTRRSASRTAGVPSHSARAAS